MSHVNTGVVVQIVEPHVFGGVLEIGEFISLEGGESGNFDGESD